MDRRHVPLGGNAGAVRCCRTCSRRASTCNGRSANGRPRTSRSRQRFCAGRRRVCCQSKAAGTSTLQVPRIRPEEEWALELLERDVLVQPGFFYDFESEAYLVVSLLTEPSLFREGLERIRNTMV